MSEGILSIKTFMAAYTTVPDREWLEISQFFSGRWIEEGEIILAQGEICRKLYFLESGLLHFFTSAGNGENVTKFFTDAPYMFTSQKSFTNQHPAEESIQALQRSFVWEMSYVHAEELLELKSWNTFIRKLILEVQHFTEMLLLEAQTSTAEERYEKMLVQGSIVNKIPLKILSSYLGIAPQSLSRIRNKLASKKRN
jgi:CRP-like cAMP-binding protein